MPGKAFTNALGHVQGLLSSSLILLGGWEPGDLPYGHVITGWDFQPPAACRGNNLHGWMRTVLGASRNPSLAEVFGTCTDIDPAHRIKGFDGMKGATHLRVGGKNRRIIVVTRQNTRTCRANRPLRR